MDVAACFPRDENGLGTSTTDARDGAGLAGSKTEAGLGAAGTGAAIEDCVVEASLGVVVAKGADCVEGTEGAKDDGVEKGFGACAGFAKLADPKAPTGGLGKGF